MKEAFLHYLWKFKKFDLTNLQTTDGVPVIIINGGQYLQLAGPDFFNAQLVIGNQKWAGNIEIHLKSSDWYQHTHERDVMYDNVILHVVWEHDADVYRCNNVPIHVLELRHYVAENLLEEYNSLIVPKNWIYCENQLHSVSDFTISMWTERLFIERLERKAITIYELLDRNKGDWEATLFCLIAKGFGLNTNGQSFLQMAAAIPFQTVRKESENLENLEALLMGQAGLLTGDYQDQYAAMLKRKYAYQLTKYCLGPAISETPQFFRLRPDNFPTIRLSQLASLYTLKKQLFAEIIESRDVRELSAILSVSASPYWTSHYNFDKPVPVKKRRLSNAFTALLIVNCIIPMKFAWSKSTGVENPEAVLEVARAIAAEPNAVISKFAIYGLKANNSFESQALLQLKNEYCSRSRCLECAIGVELLKN